MLIKLKIGRVDDYQAEDMSDFELGEMIEESRWRKGYAILNDNHVDNVYRRSGLMEVEYKFNDKIIDPKCVTCWNSSEFMDWRD